MQITFKLFATLMGYLPEGAVKNAITLEVDETTSANQLLNQYNVPMSKVHLVLINGVYINAEERDKPLLPGDTLAIWPPVAGG